MNEDRTSFEERLSAAEKRNAPAELKVQAPDGEDKKLLSFAARAGSEMLGGLLVGVLVGWGMDRWFHFRALFLVIFALLGGSAGILNIWRLMQSLEQKE